MSLSRAVQGHWRAWQMKRARRLIESRFTGPAEEIAREQWPDSLRDPTDFYIHCLRYFLTRVPETVREHRRYFSNGGRGFGEDVFHAMWFLLFREFRPANFLEIGVYRGQTLSLAALLSRLQSTGCDVHGISPFSPAGDAGSTYRQEVDYYNDTLANFAHFNLPPPNLLKAFSTDAAALALIGAKPWDLIYIDGNHDYEVARSDWDACARAVKPGGIIVMDDAGLDSPYTPAIFAFGGHPGPSRVVQEIDRTRFRELLQVGHNRVFQKLPS